MSSFNYLDSLPFSISTLGTTRDDDLDAMNSAEALDIVTSKVKTTLSTATQVPREKISWYPVTSIMKRPRSLDPNYMDYDWQHQIRMAYVVHAPHGFVGDNVIFDRDNYYSFNQPWLGNSWEHYRNIERVQREPHWVISIAAWGGEAFQHFIKDAVPRLAATIDLLESNQFRHIKIATHYKDCPFAQWFWKKLKLDDRVIQKPINIGDKFVIGAEMALYPGFYPSHLNFGFYPRYTLLPVQRRLGILDDSPQDLVIYLSRSGYGSRSVTNEDELLTQLTQFLCDTPYDLEVFNPSANFDQDMATMRRAKMVLGPHGGAFANLVFAKPGTKVIEFLPIYELVHDVATAGRNYWGFAQAAGQDYWTLRPNEFSYDGAMTVDADRLLNTMEKALT